MRFRRVSFPISAMLSIVAILLYFHPGLNLGIDFRGGTLIEVQQKSGPADLAKMRSTLNQLNLGDVQLQQFGGPENVLIRISEQPGGETAQQEAVAKVKGALGDSVEYRRVEVVGPRVSGELLSYGTIGIMLAILLFGGQAIHSFTATMMFGVVLVGTYTSVFIASPILIYLGVGTARRESEEAERAEEPKQIKQPKEAQVRKPAREPRPAARH